MRAGPARPWRSTQIVMILLCFGTGTICLAAKANANPPRWLAGVAVERTESGWDIELNFNSPLLRTSHSPEREGRLVEVMVMPLSGPSQTEDAFTF